MTKEIGWADPGFVHSSPRTQKVGGFHYLYVSEEGLAEKEVGNCMGRLFPKAFAAYEAAFGEAQPPPVVSMFFDVSDDPRTYDVQLGFAVREGTPALGEAHLRYVPPALIASILVCGNLDAMVNSYGPLMEYMNVSGLKCIEGWREWRLHWEGEDSPNNVVWVQHVAEET
jgi:hypothetical protein